MRTNVALHLEGRNYENAQFLTNHVQNKVFREKAYKNVLLCACVVNWEDLHEKVV